MRNHPLSLEMMMLALDVALQENTRAVKIYTNTLDRCFKPQDKNRKKAAIGIQIQQSIL